MADRWEDWFDDGEQLLWNGFHASGVMHRAQNIVFTAFGIPLLGAGPSCASFGLSYISSLKRVEAAP